MHRVGIDINLFMVGLFSPPTIFIGSIGRIDAKRVNCFELFENEGINVI